MTLPARHPAHLELRPDIKKWVEVDASLAIKLNEWTEIKGIFLRLESEVQPPLGYYKINNGEIDTLFLKILKQEDIESQLQADRIARWLNDRGVKTNYLMEESPRLFSSNLAALIYPYLDGRYALHTVSDMGLLGASLASLHQQLHTCPWQSEIKTQGNERQKRLTSLLNQLKKRLPENTEIPYEVISLIVTDVEQDLLDVLTDQSQVVHGDLNYGNVLFNQAGTEITFLDFEDTGMAWFSSLMELSYALERFSFTDDDEQTLALSRCVYQAYTENGGAGYQYESQLSDILRALSIRALLLLIMVCQSGRWTVPESEWKKFLMLYQQAVNRKPLLSKVMH